MFVGLSIEMCHWWPAWFIPSIYTKSNLKTISSLQEIMIMAVTSISVISFIYIFLFIYFDHNTSQAIANRWNCHWFPYSYETFGQTSWCIFVSIFQALACISAQHCTWKLENEHKCNCAMVRWYVSGTECFWNAWRWLIFCVHIFKNQ